MAAKPPLADDMSMALHTMAQAMEVMYQPMPSVEMRFPGKKGLVLLDAIQEVYRLKNAAGITIPWFDPKTGARSFVRHEFNQRVQKKVEQRYVQSVIAKGCVPGVRGVPWGVGTLGITPYKLLTYGTLSSALYSAAEMDTDRSIECVQVSIRRGLEMVDLYDPRTPADVLRWLKRFHNEWHGGSATTYLESFEDVQLVSDTWKVYCLEHGISSESGRGSESYAVLYRKYVELEFSDEFSSYNKFSHTKSIVNTLERHGVFKELVDVHGEECNFADQRLNADNFISNLHKLLVIVDGQIDKNRMAPKTISALIVEHSKLMVLCCICFVV